eukprot:scaffold95876_cov63-Phaeocystis_antarctica.AAC.1
MGGGRWVVAVRASVPGRCSSSCCRRGVASSREGSCSWRTHQACTQSTVKRVGPCTPGWRVGTAIVSIARLAARVARLTGAHEWLVLCIVAAAAAVDAGARAQVRGDTDRVAARALGRAGAGARLVGAGPVGAGSVGAGSEGADLCYPGPCRARGVTLHADAARVCKGAGGAGGLAAASGGLQQRQRHRAARAVAGAADDAAEAVGHAPSRHT